jgi:Transposase IS66 family
MHGWLRQQLDRLSGRSALAQAIRYALNHWKGLILFLDDGRLELDTNIVERAMRPLALGRNYVRSRIMLSSNRRVRLNMKQTAASRGSVDCR